MQKRVVKLPLTDEEFRCRNVMNGGGTCNTLLFKGILIGEVKCRRCNAIYEFKSSSELRRPEEIKQATA